MAVMTPESALNRDGTFGQPGEEILPDIRLELRYIEYVGITGRACFLLVRPVTEFCCTR